MTQQTDTTETPPEPAKPRGRRRGEDRARLLEDDRAHHPAEDR